MCKFSEKILGFCRNFLNSYIYGPYMARYLMDQEKYPFLNKKDANYEVVRQERKLIAKFQSLHGALGILSDTDKNLLVRELVKNSQGEYFHVERCVSHADHEAIFIPVIKGKIVTYYMYRYAHHKFYYEFLRSGQSIKDDTQEELYTAFSQCSGLEKSNITGITKIGNVCPDSILSHVKIAVYVVDLKDFDFNSLSGIKHSSDFKSSFDRNFDEVAFLTLSDVSEYIQDEKIIDGVTMSAFSLLISSLRKKAPELYQNLIDRNNTGKIQ